MNARFATAQGPEGRLASALGLDRRPARAVVATTGNLAALGIAHAVIDALRNAVAIL